MRDAFNKCNNNFTELYAADAAGGGNSTSPQGRLTLQTGTPVMTTTQSAKTTIFYTPYVGNKTPIYDGTNSATYDARLSCRQRERAEMLLISRPELVPAYTRGSAAQVLQRVGRGDAAHPARRSRTAGPARCPSSSRRGRRRQRRLDRRCDRASLRRRRAAVALITDDPFSPRVTISAPSRRACPSRSCRSSAAAARARSR